MRIGQDKVIGQVLIKGNIGKFSKCIKINQTNGVVVIKQTIAGVNKAFDCNFVVVMYKRDVVNVGIGCNFQFHVTYQLTTNKCANKGDGKYRY